MNKEEIIIAIGADHAGFELKQKIIHFLENKKIKVIDFGCDSTESVDYPDYAIKVANAVAGKESLKDIELLKSIEASKGILVCGSGTGMCITANKIKSIRAANCFNKEMAELAVQHNNINVLCLGARLINENLAQEIIDGFLNAEFEGGRHNKRIEKIHAIA